MEIKPEMQSLYPVASSLDEAKQKIESQLPIADSNELTPLLMMYHNTLISQLNSDYSFPRN